MKTYKFRVWDVKYKDWVTQDSCGVSGDGEILCYRSGGIIPSWITEYNQENFIIQQFIDLLDKNNKEIYENDIVICTISNLIDYKTTFIGVVTWDSSDCSYKLISYIDYKNNIIDKIYPISYNNTHEVVGNVHENKEILDKNV